MGCMCPCLELEKKVIRKKLEQELLFFGLVGEGSGSYAALKICLSTTINCKTPLPHTHKKSPQFKKAFYNGSIYFFI